MADILPLIQKRRSVRKFKSRTPSSLQLRKILEAGRWAPSGLNNQPWRFLVIKEEKRREGLAAFTQYGRIIKNAPILIVVCMDASVSYNRDKDLMAIGACIENRLLEAASLKLGGCWLGEITNQKKEAADFLKLDSDCELMSVVALGAPLEKKDSGTRRPLKDLILP